MSREAFEHWYADYTGDAHIRKYCDSTGRYQFNAMQSAWNAWQAALQSGEPVVAIKGWFHGECTIQPLDPAAVLPAGMALYAAPQPVVDVFDSFISPAILSFAKGEDELLVRRIWDKVRVAMLSAVNK